MSEAKTCPICGEPLEDHERITTESTAAMFGVEELVVCPELANEYFAVVIP